jgi:hypothetical protein
VITKLPISSGSVDSADSSAFEVSEESDASLELAGEFLSAQPVNAVHTIAAAVVTIRIVLRRFIF